MMRNILVTSALPYANGHIHIGHLVEYIQTDIWSRFQRLRGNRAIYICADDTHGTAIMIRAADEGRTEHELIDEMSKSHQNDFSGFDIQFDHYGSTNSEANRETCIEIWDSLKKSGMVVKKEIEQLYDTQKGMFLADRMVRGKCPTCNADDQPGDNCSKCGETYSPKDLINPISTLSGTTPETRKAEHLFVQIEQLHSFLDEWTQSGTLPPESANYLKNYFLNNELKDWDVSRPSPYFGFEIPDSPGNYWYVWFDAPIGYIASTKEWCNRENEKIEDWWKSENTEIHHFIGKDIQYFHTLFWPAMLKSSPYSLPNKIHIHGFLTVDGEKMAKSKGTFIQASTFLKHLNPSSLRYYYASRLSSKVEDIDLNLEDFRMKVNTDLIGKVINLASRSAKFISKTGLSSTYPDDGGLFKEAAEMSESIAQDYENGDFSHAMRKIIELADKANPFVEKSAPWELNKDPGKQNELQDVCTIALNLFRQLVIYLTPVLPSISEKAEELFGEKITSWDQAKTPLTGIKINKFKHMMARIDIKDVEAMTEESKENNKEETLKSDWDDSSEPLENEPIGEEISFDDFMQPDLRVARIIEANEVPEARKLIQLTLSLGGDERRNVFAGIKSAYNPEDLVGRLVIMVANLAPRKMKFGVSEGMVIASGPGGKEVFLISPDEGAQPGQRVH
ncbi:MAG: methionine--tRNA ligase [Verrucomicrobiaceae bacterium]|nr:methionine--tRNA ligase [Verrucomicrobiaceae bacterium]